jgi:hypothetical protein
MQRIYLSHSPHTFWNITDFGAKCPRYNATNTITLEKGELKKTGIEFPRVAPDESKVIFLSQI